MSTVRIQVRRGTASEWTSANPTLAAGEMGVETDTRKIKVGTGSTAWTSLAYIASDAPGITEIAQDAIDQALSMGSGLTKSYNDGANTISLGIDSTVVALKSYVDDQITGLDNAAAADYVLLADVGNAGGPAKLDVDGNLLVPKSSIILEGSSADAFETTLTVTNPTADRTLTLPDATDTLVGRATADTLTNKSISLGSNTVTSTLAQLNTAISDADVASLAGSETLSNKIVALGSNTVSGTIAQFNTAVTDADFATLAGTETLTNKTLTSPTISDPTFSGQVTGLELGVAQSLVFEGTTENAFETTLTAGDPTADRTITLPNATGTVALTSDLTPYATTVALNSVVASLNVHEAVAVATTQQLSATYTAGTSDQHSGTGIGAKLTLNSNGVLVIDGYTVAIYDRVLVKNQSNFLHNGIYELTTLGTPSVAAVLTRSADYNNSLVQTPGSIAQGDVVFVTDGTSNKLKQFAQKNEGTNTDKTVKIGIDSIEFVQSSGTATLVQGTGINITGDTISVDNTAFLSVSSAQETYLTQANAGTIYLTQANASSGYLTQSAASSTYLAKTDATSDYLSKTDAGTTYLSKTDAGTTYFAKNTDQIDNANIKSGAAIAANKISGTAVTQADTGTVTNAMLAGSIANNKLSNSTISGKALGTNLDALTIGTGLTGTSYNGSSAVTVAIDSTVATLTGSQTLTNKTITTPLGLVKGDVGLGNVDNTTDANKPISSATQTALDLKAPLASPALTGVPTAPTAAAATNTTQIATTEFVRAEVAALVNSAGSTLDTLGEIATALGNDANLSTTLTNSIALKAPLASPTFTGTVTVAAAGVAFTDGTQTKEGVPSRTPIISKTADYTLSAASERDSLIEVNSTDPVTITIPTNDAVAYPIGTTLDILGVNTGLITIAGDTGVTVNATPGLKLRTQWSSCTLFKRNTNSWVVYGDLKS